MTNSNTFDENELAAEALEDSPMPPKREGKGIPRTTRDWNEVIGKLFRDARRGKISEQRACRLAYVANIGLRAAEAVEQAEQRQQLIDLLQRSTQGGALPHLDPALKSLIDGGQS